MISEAELLAKLRERKSQEQLGWSPFVLPEHKALALLTSWRDEAVRATYVRAQNDLVEAVKDLIKQRGMGLEAALDFRARTTEPEQHG